MKRMNDPKRSYVRVKVEAVESEKIINYLLNNGVEVNNITRVNAFSILLDIKVEDFSYLKTGVKKLGGKLEVVKRSGPLYISLKLKHRKLLVGGIAVFFIILYYLSSFVWKVDISTDRYLAPLEVRNILRSYGIDVGTKKKSINVLDTEKYLVRDIDEIMWVKVRLEGSRLSVEIVERQEPPKIRGVEYTGDLVAGKSGVVNRIYTSAGTATVKPNDVVSKGDLVVKGEEGEEERKFSIKAEGRVFATTFYEEIVNMPKYTKEMQYTGEKAKGYGIKINNKRFYIKKPLNNFENCDKIERKWGIFIKEEDMAMEEVKIDLDTEAIIKGLENKITLNLDRGAKILVTNSEVTEEGDEYRIRVLVTVEEDIAKSQVVNPEDVEEESPNT